MAFHPGTTILIKVGDTFEHITVEAFFLQKALYATTGDEDQIINLADFKMQIWSMGDWTLLKSIRRYYLNGRLLRFATGKGNIFSVTFEHSCHMSKWIETVTSPDGLTQTEETRTGHGRCAAQVIGRGYEILSSPVGAAPVTPGAKVNITRAYLTGALLGDGSISGGIMAFHHHNALRSSFAEKFKSIYGDLFKQGEWSFGFGTEKDAVGFQDCITDDLAYRHFPPEWLSWQSEAQGALLAGLLDTEGTVNRATGMVNLTLSSLGLIQQVAELAARQGFGYARTSLVKNTDNFETPPLYNIQMHGLSNSVVQNSELLQFFASDLQNDAGVEMSDSDEILQSWAIPFIGYVYEITTDSGTFYTNGLVG